MAQQKKPPMDISEIAENGEEVEKRSGPKPLRIIEGHVKNVGPKRNSNALILTVMSVVISIALSTMLVTKILPSKADVAVVQSSLDTKLSGTANELASLTRRLDNVVNAQGDYAKKSTTDQYQSQIQSLQSSIEGLKSSVSSLSPQLQSFSDREKVDILALTDKISKLSGDLTTLGSSSTQASSKVASDLKSAVDSVAALITRVDTLNASVTSLTARVIKLETPSVSTNTSVGSLEYSATQSGSTVTLKVKDSKTESVAFRASFFPSTALTLEQAGGFSVQLPGVLSYSYGLDFATVSSISFITPSISMTSQDEVTKSFSFTAAAPISVSTAWKVVLEPVQVAISSTGGTW